MKTSFVAIPGPNVPLFAAIDRPDGDAPAVRSALRQGIVFHHGLGSYRSGPHDLLNHLSRLATDAGFTCLRFDFSGHGDSLELSHLKPGRHSFAEVLANMVRESLAVKAHFIERERIDRLLTVGICSGAMTGLLSFLEHRVEGEDGIVLLAVPPMHLYTVRHAVQRLWSTVKTYLRKAASITTWGRLFRGEIDIKTIARSFMPFSRAKPPGGGTAEKAEVPSGQRECAAGRGGLSTPPRHETCWIPKSARKGGKGNVLLVAPSWDATPRNLADFRAFFRESGLIGKIEIIDGSDHNFSTPEATARVSDLLLGWLGELPGPARPTRKVSRALGPLPAGSTALPAVVQGERVGPRRVWVRLHRPVGVAGSEAPTLVLVPPFFHERNSAYSSLVALRNMLVDAGWNVATFDPSGLGESVAVEPLPTWTDHRRDLEAVAEYVRRETGASTLTYAGLRLGATLAVLAATCDAKAARVVALEPVISGRRYVHELAAASMFNGTASGRRPARDRVEVSTFRISGSLVEELRTVDLARLSFPPRLDLSFWRLSGLAAARREMDRLTRELRNRTGTAFEDRPGPPFWSRIAEQAELELLKDIATDIAGNGKDSRIAAP